MQYAQTLPLRDHEIVLSFDDGPSPVTTEKVLDALAVECVRANFFIVGEHAKERPDLVRRAYQEGHAIGTHSQTHADLSRLSLAAAIAGDRGRHPVRSSRAWPATDGRTVLPRAVPPNDGRPSSNFCSSAT